MTINRASCKASIWRDWTGSGALKERRRGTGPSPVFLGGGRHDGCLHAFFRGGWLLLLLTSITFPWVRRLWRGFWLLLGLGSIWVNLIFSWGFMSGFGFCRLCLGSCLGTSLGGCPCSTGTGNPFTSQGCNLLRGGLRYRRVVNQDAWDGPDKCKTAPIDFSTRVKLPEACRIPLYQPHSNKPFCLTKYWD